MPGRRPIWPAACCKSSTRPWPRTKKRLTPSPIRWCGRPACWGLERHAGTGGAGARRLPISMPPLAGSKRRMPWCLPTRQVRRIAPSTSARPTSHAGGTSTLAVTSTTPSPIGSSLASRVPPKARSPRPHLQPRCGALGALWRRGPASSETVPARRDRRPERARLTPSSDAAPPLQWIAPEQERTRAPAAPRAARAAHPAQQDHGEGGAGVLECTT
jgi:hypothetical protein